MSEDDEFQKSTELLLQHRLRRYRDDLHLQGMGDPEASHQLVRGELINVWTDALKAHGERALADLLTLAKAFEARSPEGVQRAFDGHIDGLAEELSGMLASAGERRKLMNLATAVKVQGRDEVARSMALAAKLRLRAETLEGPSGALDGLLPLEPRGEFDRALARMVRGATPKEPLSLLMIDLDHFKRVNDQHGHQSGDQVLLGVAHILVSCLMSKGASAYRYGGEELAVLLPNYTVDESIGFGERIRKEIEAAVLGNKSLKVTASLGLAVAPDHASDAEGLLGKADAALYEAKNAGRNRLRVSGSNPGLTE